MVAIDMGNALVVPFQMHSTQWHCFGSGVYRKVFLCFKIFGCFLYLSCCVGKKTSVMQSNIDIVDGFPAPRGHDVSAAHNAAVALIPFLKREWII